MTTADKPTRSTDQDIPDQSSSADLTDERGADTSSARPPCLSPIDVNARIAKKAYELFEARGRQDGRGVQDWLEAERLVKQELKDEGFTGL